MTNKNFETIDEYIQTAPNEARERLREMRDCLRTAAPETHEVIKWDSLGSLMAREF